MLEASLLPTGARSPVASCYADQVYCTPSASALLHHPNNLLVILAQFAAAGEPSSAYGPDFIARRIVVEGLEDARRTILLPAKLFEGPPPVAAQAGGAPQQAATQTIRRRGQKVLFERLMRMPRSIRPLVLGGSGATALASIAAQLVHYAHNLRVLYLRPPQDKQGDDTGDALADKHTHARLHAAPASLQALMRRARGISFTAEDISHLPASALALAQAHGQDTGEDSGEESKDPSDVPFPSVPVLHPESVYLVDAATGCHFPGPESTTLRAAAASGAQPLHDTQDAEEAVRATARVLTDAMDSLGYEGAVWHVVLDVACLTLDTCPCASRARGQSGPAPTEGCQSCATASAQDSDGASANAGFTTAQLLTILSSIPGPVVAMDVIGFNPRCELSEAVATSLDNVMPAVRWYAGLAGLQEAANTVLPPPPAAATLSLIQAVPELSAIVASSAAGTAFIPTATTTPQQQGTSSPRTEGLPTGGVSLVPVPVPIAPTPSAPHSAGRRRSGSEPAYGGVDLQLPWRPNVHAPTGSLWVDGREAVYSPALALGLHHGTRQLTPPPMALEESGAGQGGPYAAEEGISKQNSRIRRDFALYSSSVSEASPYCGERGGFGPSPDVHHAHGYHGRLGSGSGRKTVLVPVPVPLTTAAAAALSIAGHGKLNPMGKYPVGAHACTVVPLAATLLSYPLCPRCAAVMEALKTEQEHTLKEEADQDDE